MGEWANISDWGIGRAGWGGGLREQVGPRQGIQRGHVDVVGCFRLLVGMHVGEISVKDTRDRTEKMAGPENQEMKKGWCVYACVRVCVCVCVSLDGREGVKARPALLGSLRRKVLWVGDYATKHIKHSKSNPPPHDAA